MDTTGKHNPAQSARKHIALSLQSYLQFQWGSFGITSQWVSTGLFPLKKRRGASINAYFEIPVTDQEVRLAS